MIDKIDSVVNAIGGFLYQPYIVPLFLIVAGLYFTIRTGLIQFRLFGESIHVVAEKPKEKGSISSFGALMVSTASRVGTGNIVHGHLPRRLRRRVLDVGRGAARRGERLHRVRACAGL